MGRFTGGYMFYLTASKGGGGGGGGRGGGTPGFTNRRLWDLNFI